MKRPEPKRPILKVIIEVEEERSFRLEYTYARFEPLFGIRDVVQYS